MIQKLLQRFMPCLCKIGTKFLKFLNHTFLLQHQFLLLYLLVCYAFVLVQQVKSAQFFNITCLLPRSRIFWLYLSLKFVFVILPFFWPLFLAKLAPYLLRFDEAKYLSLLFQFILSERWVLVYKDEIFRYFQNS